MHKRKFYYFWKMTQLLTLALFPAIVLLYYIYKKDTVEEEPTKLLLACLCAGAICIIPACLFENLLSFLLIDGLHVQKGSIAYALVAGVLVAGLCEEGCKYIVLRLVTWKNKNFDYMFDGIVYAVFVSLGFAAVENILYVFENGGVSTAIMRMFTAIPGHTCYGVIMGYFYGAAKQASLEGRTKAYRVLCHKTLLIPMILHGIYDALLMTNAQVVGKEINQSLLTLWFLFIFLMFKRSFALVNLASKYDQKF